MLVGVISYGACSMLRVFLCALRVACKNVVTATVTELHCFSFPQDTVVKPTVKFSNKQPIPSVTTTPVETQTMLQTRRKTEKAAV